LSVKVRKHNDLPQPDMCLDYIDDSTLKYRACMVSTMVRRDIAFDTAPEKEQGISDLCFLHSRKGVRIEKAICGLSPCCVTEQV
jgi:hypothetical protein